MSLKTWTRALVGLVIGLAVGPFVANSLGWLVTTDVAAQQVESAIVGEQAEMCEMRARNANQNVASLAAQERVALAKRYAEFTWDDHVRSMTVTRCSNALSHEAAKPDKGGQA